MFVRTHSFEIQADEEEGILYIKVRPRLGGTVELLQVADDDMITDLLGLLTGPATALEMVLT